MQGHPVGCSRWRSLSWQGDRHTGERATQRGADGEHDDRTTDSDPPPRPARIPRRRGPIADMLLRLGTRRVLVRLRAQRVPVRLGARQVPLRCRPHHVPYAGRHCMHPLERCYRDCYRRIGALRRLDTSSPGRAFPDGASAEGASADGVFPGRAFPGVGRSPCWRTARSQGAGQQVV